MEQISFVFYTEWDEYFTDLSNEEIGEMMRAILNYKKTGEVPSFSDRSLKFVFNLIKNQLDRDAEKWEETKNKRSDAGKRGASKRWNNEQPSEEMAKDSNAIVCHNVPSEEMAKMAVNVNVNEDVNVNVNDNVNVDVPKADLAGHFSPQINKIPSLSQIQAYCEHKSYVQDPKRFFEYYNSKDWIVSGSVVSNWQKLCDKWETTEKSKPIVSKKYKKPDIPELPVCRCGNKAIYAQDGVCRCEKCIDHYWELEQGSWKLYEKVEIGLKIPRGQNAG